MNTYAIPDLHGRSDLLEAALTKIERNPPGTIVFLGDYVDRGPNSKLIITRLMAGPPDGWTWVCLRGNHEDMLLECHNDTGNNRVWWFNNGGSATVESYGGQIDPDHLEWLAHLPAMHTDPHRVYVHAGVDERYELDQQPEAVTQWIKYPNYVDIGYRGQHVVHGHDAAHGPWFGLNRTNLDAGAYKFGMLCVGVFDDSSPGGSVNVLRIGV